MNIEEHRWHYFKEHVLLPLLRTGQTRTIIIAPNYVHYIRIRNELMNLEANAAFICEYSRDSEISRGRSRFYHGRHDILLYSGRCHYFRRYKIRGAQHAIFYSLPEYPHFYSEMLNMLSSQSDIEKITKQPSLAKQNYGTSTSNTGNSGSCTSLTLFTQLDKQPLQRVVGNKRSKHMLKSEKSTFMFQ